MTDEQIIKALEHNASKCKFYEDGQDGGLFESTLDLINRQKAEIEGLQERISYLEKSIDCSRKEYNNLLQKLQQAKSEAIKEFAKRLKNKIWYNPACNHYRTITPDDIYDLARKMTEE